MTPQELASTLTTVSQKLKTEYKLPIATRASELKNLQKIIKLNIYYEDDIK